MASLALKVGVKDPETDGALVFTLHVETPSLEDCRLSEIAPLRTAPANRTDTEVGLPLTVAVQLIAYLALPKLGLQSADTIENGSTLGAGVALAPLVPPL